MAGGRRLAAVGVVRDFVSPQDVGALVNLGVAVQLIDIAGLFLLQGADRGRVGILGCGLAGTERACRRGCAIILGDFICGRSRGLAGIL